MMLASLKATVALLLILSSATAVFSQEAGCAIRTLPVSVQDMEGNQIHGLLPVDFVARIRGKPLRILSIAADTRPHRLVILLDTSASMRDSLWNFAVKLALNAAESSGPGVHLALVLFGKDVNEVEDFSDGNAAVIDRLKEISSDADFTKKEIRGRTALYDAIASGFRLLDHPTSADVLYIITDADDNTSHLKPADVQRLLAANMVRLFALLVQKEPLYRDIPDEELIPQKYLANLAEATGGSVLVSGEVWPSAERWEMRTVGGEPLPWQEATQRFYPSLLENDVITLQMGQPIHNRVRLKLNFSKACPKKCKFAQILHPYYIEPCLPGAQ
jgi:von Willebrand factor type A domain